MKNKFIILSLSLAIIVLIAGGCSEKKSSDKNIEGFTSDLKIKSGTRLDIRQTIFGLGAKIAEINDTEQGKTGVEITQWDYDGEIALKWQRKMKVETEESIQARKDFEKNQVPTPIGEEEPKGPDPKFDEIDVEGKVTANNSGDINSIFIPAYWSEGEKSLENNGIIWLSKKNYQELVDTRKTHLRLGLFDDAIAIAGGSLDKANEALKKLGADAEKIKDDPYLLEADGDFSEFSLKVNGETEKVQVIKARNWFGEYIILNNPDNPIILKATLNPLSYGALDILSPLGILKSLLGYEVTSIEF